jgi:heme-degrading monooxygenase HmoA
MILEAACLNVIAGREREFEDAFRKASPLIASIPGYLSYRLERCIETPSRYLLLVEWKTLEDHVQGFRQSPQYTKWKQLLHHFYEPFPAVEHFEGVDLSGI